MHNGYCASFSQFWFTDDHSYHNIKYKYCTIPVQGIILRYSNLLKYYHYIIYLWIHHINNIKPSSQDLWRTDTPVSSHQHHIHIYYNYVVTSHTRHLPPKSRSMSQLCGRNLLSDLVDLSIWCICIKKSWRVMTFFYSDRQPASQTGRQTARQTRVQFTDIDTERYANVHIQTHTHTHTHTHRVTHVLTDFDAHLCINIWTPLHVCITKKM